MLTFGIQRWAVRGATVAVWALAAGGAVFWGLRLGSPAPAPAAPVALPAGPVPDAAAIARLLGAASGPAVAEAPALAGRFSLTGVVADRQGVGAALIAVDGRPARPYRVGAEVAEGLWLQAVEPRQARLGVRPQGPASLLLELPPLKR